MWRGVAGRLEGVALDAPDLPGHGAAPDWDGRGDYHDACMGVARGGPATVIGHSLGGTLALRLAAEGAATRLILVEPVMFAAATPALVDAHRDEMRPFDALLAAGDRTGAARYFHDLWGQGAWQDLSPRARSYIVDRIHLIPAAAPAILDDVHGVLDALPDIPVLVVTRTDPPAIVAGIVDGLRARMSGVEVMEMGHGHMIPTEAPVELAEAVTAFLTGEPPVRAGR